MLELEDPMMDLGQFAALGVFIKGSIDLHTSDGSTLRDSGTKEQNEVGAHPAAALSEHARNQ